MVFLFIFTRENTRRFMRFAPYANALELFLDEEHRMPEGIQELENFYSHHPLRHVPYIPVDGEVSRPVVVDVPIGESENLYLLEPTAGTWYGRAYRYALLIARNPDGTLHCRLQKYWFGAADEFQTASDQ